MNGYFRRNLRILTCFLSLFILLFNFTFIRESQASSYGIMPIDFDDYNDKYYNVFPSLDIKQDSENYIYDYTIYLSDGRHSGSFVLPKAYHDMTDWFIFYNISTHQLNYVSFPNALNNTIYCKVNNSNYNFDLGIDEYVCSFADRTNNWKLTDAICRVYDESDKLWSSGESFNSEKFVRFPVGKLVPNSIITTSTDLKILYVTSNDVMTNYSSCKDNQAFIAPILYTNNNSSTGHLESFTLRLYDFYTHDTNLSYLKRSDVLKELKFKLYLKSGMQLWSELDLLNGSYPIQQGSFSDDIDYPNYVEISGNDLQIALKNDYVVEIDASINSHQTNENTKDIRFDTDTLFTYKGYYRLTLDGGMGKLIPSTESGEPKEPVDPDNPDNPDNPDDGSDKVVDALGGLGNTISDQTSKIEEQTNKIEEQTEVQKNIFQQLLDIPR